MKSDRGYSALEVLLLLLLLGLIAFTGWYVWNSTKKANKNQSIAENQKQKAESQYNPKIDPADFVSKVDNKYFTLTPGTKYTYSNSTEDGLEKIETVVTKQNELILGVTTIAVNDKSWLNDDLVEDTTDWYAQDKKGNVWYFGEYVNNYEGGKIKDHNGSWKAGTDGAKPGIIMEAEPKVRDSYRQEFYKGKAEDRGDVVSLTEKVSVKYGDFTDCIETKDYSLLETTVVEYKYYCPKVGFLTQEKETVNGKPERIELVSVTNQ